MYVEYGQFEPECHDRSERDVLAKALRFTQPDLVANQSGWLSKSQCLSLLANLPKAAGALLISLAPIAFFCGLIFCLTAFGWELKTFVRPEARLSRRFILMAGMCLAGIVTMLTHLSGLLGRNVAITLRAARLIADLATGQVACLAGRVTTNRSADLDPLIPSDAQRYYLCLEDLKFEVPQRAYDEIEAQNAVAFLTLYYTPRSHYLVAAEPVRSMHLL